MQQYWSGGKDSYRYIPVRAFSEAFQQTPIARGNMEYLEQPYESPNPKCEEALITHKYALPCESCLKSALSAVTVCHSVTVTITVTVDVAMPTV